MVLRACGEKAPKLGSEVYVDESAQVIGDVTLKDRASVWPLAVLRADDDSVEIGRGSAVMDCAFCEGPWGRPLVVGDRCIVSHGARLHGCTIGPETLIGIGAIVLDGATVGERCLVAAGSLIPPGAKVPPESFVMGVPAKVVRKVGEGDLASLRSELEVLSKKAARYRASGRTVGQQG